MSENALGFVEQGLRIAEFRAAVLAEDAANARSTGFAARDVGPVIDLNDGILSFGATLREARTSGSAGTIEFAMGATAENSIRFRALADQERAMLHEVRLIAEDARR